MSVDEHNQRASLEGPEQFARHYQDASCVFFDCDGVIFDSNGFKRRAMRQALSGQEPGLLDAMESYWRSHGGVSRFDKFEYFFTRIAPVPNAFERRQRVDQAVAAFSVESLAAYQRARPEQAALTLARDAGSQRCVVVSGAADAELQAVFEREKIRPLFSQVLGSPPTKQELVKRVLEQRRLDARACLLIGDGGGDYRVCKALEMPFVYLNQYSEWREARATLASAQNVLWADDWQQLLSWLCETR